MLGRRHPQRVLRTYAGSLQRQRLYRDLGLKTPDSRPDPAHSRPAAHAFEPATSWAGLSTSMNWLVESPVEVSVPFRLTNGRAISSKVRGSDPSTRGRCWTLHRRRLHSLRFRAVTRRFPASRCDRIAELAQALARTRPDADDIATTST